MYMLHADIDAVNVHMYVTVLWIALPNFKYTHVDSHQNKCKRCFFIILKRKEKTLKTTANYQEKSLKLIIFSNKIRMIFIELFERKKIDENRHFGLFLRNSRYIPLKWIEIWKTLPIHFPRIEICLKRR